MKYRGSIGPAILEKSLITNLDENTRMVMSSFINVGKGENCPSKGENNKFKEFVDDIIELFSRVCRGSLRLLSMRLMRGISRLLLSNCKV